MPAVAQTYSLIQASYQAPLPPDWWALVNSLVLLDADCGTPGCTFLVQSPSWQRNTENRDKALPGCWWLLMFNKLAFYNNSLMYAFNYIHAFSWFHWNPQNYAVLCFSPLILSLLPRAWDGRRPHQREGNTFPGISISGPATSSRHVLTAFQITEHHMYIRKPWSSQPSDASLDVTTKNGVPSSLFPEKATQNFWKTSQMRSFLLTQRLSLHRSPMIRRFEDSWWRLWCHLIRHS